MNRTSAELRASDIMQIAASAGRAYLLYMALDSVSYPHAAWLGLSILYSGKHGYTDIFQEEGKHDLYGMQENVEMPIIAPGCGIRTLE